MSNLTQNINGQTTLDIIAFQLGEQTFCIETTSVREIRGWAASTPLPHASPELLGIINLRGMVIPTIDLSRKTRNALRRDHGEKRHRRGGSERHAVGIGGRSGDRHAVCHLRSIAADTVRC